MQGLTSCNSPFNVNPFVGTDGRPGVRDHGRHGRIQGVLPPERNLPRNLHRSCRLFLLPRGNNMRHAGKYLPTNLFIFFTNLNLLTLEII